jgi:hypothetical protein
MSIRIQMVCDSRDALSKEVVSRLVGWSKERVSAMMHDALIWGFFMITDWPDPSFKSLLHLNDLVDLFTLPFQLALKEDLRKNLTCATSRLTIIRYLTLLVTTPV